VLAVRLFLLSHEEVELVYAVDRPVGRNLAASDASECRKEIDDGNDLVADTPTGNFARPADNAWGTAWQICPLIKVKYIYLGLFGTLEEANAAYAKAAQGLFRDIRESSVYISIRQIVVRSGIHDNEPLILECELRVRWLEHFHRIDRELNGRARPTRIECSNLSR
jgi:hypothetical protein